MNSPDRAAVESSLHLGELTSLTNRVVYFPVRHHSPTAAQLVCELIDRINPAAVLIEGPADYNERMAELMLPHRPPIAIYSFVVFAEQDGTPASRRGVYYPLCEHSPEWQAARHGHNSGAIARFIDMPWPVMAAQPEELETNRYADRHLGRSRYSKVICERLGVDNFNDAWDTLCEVDPDITLEDYLQRCHLLCATLRLMDGQVPASDRAREAYMAGHIRKTLEEVPGQVLVVTGGYHSLGLLELLANPPTEEKPQEAPKCEGEAPQPLRILESGIALTPYSFERLDALAGYEAGMPNPGFYHELWKWRTGKPKQEVHQKLLRDVVLHLRDAKQRVSSADLIAAETTARALAAVRSHKQVWRTDLLDGLAASMVKDDVALGMRHPVMDAIHEVLRGGERGQLAEGTALPPLVADIEKHLEKFTLRPGKEIRTIDLDLSQTEPRERNRILHRFRLLELGGYALVGSTIDEPSAPAIVDTWEIRWAPDFPANCIEASRYGATLLEAVAAKLAETAAKATRNAALAAKLVLDASLAGLDKLSDDLMDRVRELILTDADFFSIALALHRLLTLFRYDQALGTTGRPDLGQLLKETFERAVWLLESLGNTTGKDQETIDGIRVMIDTFERCDHSLGLDRKDLLDVFRRVTTDTGQNPVTRGATLGGLWVLGEADGDAVTQRLREFADPEMLGDFLSGLFALAREQVQRHKALLLSINEVLQGFNAEDFLAALPSLRLAFTYFTPREKHQLALTLRVALGLEKEPELAALSVDIGTAAAVMAFEERLFSTAKKYGIKY